ncbi:TPA: macro domain-containing protein [Escherichia coli]|nr:macro domain-containing protein [Escherichia coli]
MKTCIHVVQGDITKLAVDVIVNAANPSLMGGGGVDGAIHRAAGPALLDAYLNSLRLVAANSYTSVAFPAISTGVYGYPRAAAAEIAVKTVSEFITRHALPEQVYFVCYDEENAHLYERLLTQQGDE